MKEKELEFNRIVKANKAAIFTVCYLFSKDQDEVNDLFQETLINLFTDTDDDTRQVQMLYRRINKLGVLDRAIILLWLENMSYEEIGEIIGISTKNVSVKLVRIKEQLKKMSND